MAQASGAHVSLYDPRVEIEKRGERCKGCLSESKTIVRIRPSDNYETGDKTGVTLCKVCVHLALEALSK